MIQKHRYSQYSGLRDRSNPCTEIPHAPFCSCGKQLHSSSALSVLPASNAKSFDSSYKSSHRFSFSLRSSCSFATSTTQKDPLPHITAHNSPLKCEVKKHKCAGNSTSTPFGSGGAGAGLSRLNSTLGVSEKVPDYPNNRKHGVRKHTCMHKHIHTRSLGQSRKLTHRDCNNRKSAKTAQTTWWVGQNPVIHS